MMVAALLLRLGLAPTAADALTLFGEARTHDGKGVTIPSQVRYVHYYEALLRAPAPPPQRTLRLKHIRMHTVPNFDLTTGCDPFFDVRQGDGKLQVFNWLTAHGGRVDNYKPRTSHTVDFAVWPGNDVCVTGDTKVVFYDKDDYSEPDKMFHFWFHTAFVEGDYLRLPCVRRCSPARARPPLTRPHSTPPAGSLFSTMRSKTRRARTFPPRSRWSCFLRRLAERWRRLPLGIRATLNSTTTWTTTMISSELDYNIIFCVDYSCRSADLNLCRASALLEPCSFAAPARGGW